MSGQGRFSILHDSDTDLGRVILRRRWSFALERDVYEMTLDGDLVMSDAIVESEQALAAEALALLARRELTVLVGGLGFGFTVRAALQDARIRKLTVIERLGLVHQWHRTGVLPWSDQFMGDPRLEVIEGDFFAMLLSDQLASFDIILIDIDDAPSHLWHASHAGFYDASGADSLERHLEAGGVAAMWSSIHPGLPFISTLESRFEQVRVIEIVFENPSLHQPETNYIVLATKSSAARITDRLIQSHSR